MPLNSHIDEDLLEAYSLGRISDNESVPLEEHLLSCQTCQEQLEKTDDFVRAFRVAARAMPAVKPVIAPNIWSWLTGKWAPGPMAAALAVAAVAVVCLAPKTAGVPKIAEIQLTALRGVATGVIATVPANHQLKLELDAKALSGAAFRIELADSRGRQLWQSTEAAPVSHNIVRTTVPRPIPAGIYWVRLYDPVSGQLVREYGLRAQ